MKVLLLGIVASFIPIIKNNAHFENILLRGGKSGGRCRPLAVDEGEHDAPRSKMFSKCALFLIIGIICFGCQEHGKTLKVAASSVPHAEILEKIKADLKVEGITLRILEIDDYNTPNRLLADGEVDANFFQHRPFLEKQIEQFGFELTVLETIHLEPLGIYSKKVDVLSNLPPKRAIVAIPNDPTNEARALALLQDQGLIRIKSEAGLLATPLDIAENPLNLRFEEVDAAFLARTLEDVHLAVIPANFALLASLCPQIDALALESSKGSPYANLVAIRKGTEETESLLALKKHLTSEKMRIFILERFQGGIHPSF